MRSRIPPCSDIALCSGQQEDSSLIQTGLGSITPILVGNIRDEESFPQTPQELIFSKTIAADIFSDWTLQNINDETVQFKVLKTHTHFCNDMNVNFNLAKAGAGIALLPLSMVYEAIEKRELTHVLPEWQGPARKLYLVWPYQKTISARAKAFRTALTDFLHQQPWFEPL
ncbi:hypothetical protein CA267_002225 [Alteromonas pelagimontana]|uniref:LysR substrate-binding domain-containing protein n=1 Tax=Alteromonas pelagimontana TaxID=1858656 RepID=A0A6M4M9Q0_9ALTE|nr:LysR substrate-binding domain-containing protein [Alteromonas pelagimontana]QJR79699.1 hypothetical protein CA267_002225 [Alteromonas pelagimontana]